MVLAQVAKITPLACSRRARFAAVDGSPATDWQPVSVPAKLTAPTSASRRTVGHVVVTWGRLWPEAPKPNVHPPAHPVRVLRPGAYSLQVSTNGKRWVTVGSVTGHRSRVTDTFTFPKVKARFIRLAIKSGTGISVTQTINNKKKSIKQMPMLEELTATG